jgi:hypothetical protein
VFRDGISPVGTAVAADAPPASDKDTPTTPTTGTASLRRFRFEVCFVCGIECSHVFDARGTIRTCCIGALQGRLRTPISIAYSGLTPAHGGRRQDGVRSQNAPGRIEFPDFMNDIVAASIMK